MVARPHGGRLVRLAASDKTKERILSEREEYPRMEIPEDTALDLENIAWGVYSPLKGFLNSEDLEHVLYHMRLSDDIPWTIPILLPRFSEGFSEGDSVLLTHKGKVVARITVEEVYTFDRREIAQRVFRTTDPDHPGVRRLSERPDTYVSGDILLIEELPNPFSDYTLKPHETRVLFKEKGWKTIIGFQTRNVPHLGHEYVQKSALTFVDGLLINPVLGRKKPGDYRDNVILRAYQELFKHYYPRNTAVLSFLRYPMRYAGPREAVHHAIMRKNLGCTHFAVGRDHAGVGNYYGPYDAHEIFKEFPDLGITPLFFREFFYCKKCGGIVNEKICPHGEENRIRFSGTKIRDMIRKGERPPEYFMRPEVFEVVKSFDNPFVEVED